MQYKDYKQWWQGRTQQEKLDYLNAHQKKIAEKYGFQPMTITAEDLDDSKGDSRGENRGSQLVIDTDNLNNDPPWRVVEIVAHESRHEYQEYVVSQYRTNGSIPDGVKQEQVEAWGKCFDDYAEPVDDFESYWGQDIESDARAFGNDYMQEVFKSEDWKDKS